MKTSIRYRILILFSPVRTSCNIGCQIRASRLEVLWKWFCDLFLVCTHGATLRNSVSHTQSVGKSNTQRELNNSVNWQAEIHDQVQLVLGIRTQWANARATLSQGLNSSDNIDILNTDDDEIVIRYGRFYNNLRVLEIL